MPSQTYLIRRSQAALAFGILVTLLAVLFPSKSLADPCDPAAPKGIAVFDTVIGQIKVDTAFLGDSWSGKASPSMRPTFFLWYPDATPVEPKTQMKRWLCPVRNTDRFIVEFRLDESANDKEPSGAFATIARARANLRQTGTDIFQSTVWADHNLNGPVSGERDYFVMDDNGARIAILDCTAWRGSAAPPNPLCSGLIGFFDRGFVVHVVMPAELGFDGTVAKWQAVADFIDQQIALWRN
jgi:hypothetical protein